MDTAQKQIRDDLVHLATERAILRRRQIGLRQQLRYAVLDGYESGLTVIEMAQLLDVTRRAVYDLLESGGA